MLAKTSVMQPWYFIYMYPKASEKGPLDYNYSLFIKSVILVCITVVWKYFIGKKISWAMNSTKKFYMNMNNNNEVYVTAVQYWNTIYINPKT